jgi:hypothetical protein
MEPVTVVVNAGQIYFVLGALAGFVGGWFLGRQVQRRREEGMTTKEALLNTKDKVDALTIDQIKPYLQVILNEVKKAKEPPLT